LPLQDLAQSLPGVVVAALLPGFAVATLLAPRWRWWQRLAMAPGLSAGFIGVIGLAMHDIHIPFEPLTVLPLIALVVAASIVRRRRTDLTAQDGGPWWLAIPALAAGLIGAGIFVWALHGQVLPPDWDAPTHAGIVNDITRTHNVLPLVQIPLEGSDYVRARPGFEATAAVVSWLGGPSPAGSMAPVMAVTLILLPLSLTLLTFETTGSVALSAVVPLFALGLAFPSGQVIIGRFPEIIDSTLVVPFLVAALRVVRGLHVRDNALLLLAITMSIWVIHGLEILTALVIGCFLLAAIAVRAARATPRAALARIGIAVVATLGGAVLATVLTRVPRVPKPTATDASPVVFIATSSPVRLHQILASIAQTDLISPVTLALFGIGAVALLIRRRMLWILGAEAVLVLLMADNFYLHKLNSFWRAVYPWGEMDRLLGLQYFLIPLVLAVGLFAVADLLRLLSHTRRRQLIVTIAALAVAAVAFLARHPLGHLWTSVWATHSVFTYPLGVFDPLGQLRPWILAMAIAAVAVLIAWIALARRTRFPGVVAQRLRAVAPGLDVAGASLGIIAALCLVIGAGSELSVYRSEVAGRSMVSPADLTALATLNSTLPKGTVVMTDGGNDAGMWLAGLTGLTPLVPNGFDFLTLSIPLDVALADACSDPVFAVAALSRMHRLYGASVVYIGAHSIDAPEYRWDINCVAALPDLRLITSARSGADVAAAFAVVT
jgi:uncharacterized protein DUF6541